MKKFYLLLFGSFCFLYGSFAQTIINPIAGGGFDLGNTFALNGWTVVNSSANKWVVGSHTYNSPPNSAYVSIDGDTANYSYDNATLHISHFYQQVSIPANATNVVLAIYVKGNVEYDGSGNLLDGLKIYVDPSLTPPTADALPAGIPVFFQASQDVDYVGTTVNLNLFSGKKVLIIFTWINDGDGIGSGPPASVDDVLLKYCIKNTNYALTGGGGFCTGTSGAAVGLAGSVSGINYQLYWNSNAVGSPIAGTGAPIDFGPQKAVGNYTVIGTSGDCSYTMPGSVDVSENPLPTPTVSSNSPVCLGASLNLTAGGGTSYSWTGPNGFTSIAQNPIVANITGADAGKYIVTVTDANSCSALDSVSVALGAAGAGGSVSSDAVCSGGSGTLTLSGQSGSIVRWESSTDSASWNPIVNTGNSQSFNNITVPTWYRAITNGGCGNTPSTAGLVVIHNLWTGTISSDWNTAGNWSDKQVPTTSCDDVIIPGGTTYQPVISSSVPGITNIFIHAGATLTINNGTLTLRGSINETSMGSIIALTGTVNLNGSILQTIPAGAFQNNALNNLIISNTSASGVSLGGNLDIYQSVTYGSGGTLLSTGGYLTLKSTQIKTAWLGDMTGHTINGNVTVERYIATGTTGAPNHGKSWQLLAVPTQGQTIKQSWQEGATATNISSPAPGSPGNPVAGFGTMVTGDVAGAATQPSPGFDAFTSTGASVKVYNYLTGLYVGPPNTNSTQVYNQKGYFVFVRGDRSVYTAAGAANPTVLRTKGQLFTPANPPPSTTVFAGKFESAGNPYASAIDVRKLGLNGVDSFFTVWDPRLNGTYNYGAFQTFYKIDPSNPNSDYAVQPGGGSYGLAGTVNNYIQSGQAFFIQATASNGILSFSESAKAGVSSLFTIPNSVPVAQHTLRTSLNTVNADGSTGSILDGVLSSFNDNYSNEVDGMDARKSMNSGENLAIKSGGKLLVIERRETIMRQDTIFLNITGERIQLYRFHFDAENLNSQLQGFFEDNYLETRTPINMSGTTEITFSIANVAGSYAADRFRIVFAPMNALPVTFTSLKAYQQDKHINVEWKVTNEMNIRQYTVEKSVDGITFQTIAMRTASANNGGSATYVVTDMDPVEGYNYFRIQSEDINGQTAFTNVVKVLIENRKPDITIYPNPITDGMIRLQFINQPQGKYVIRFYNKLAQVIIQTQVSHAGGNSTQIIKWDFNLAHGMYRLEVTKPGGTTKVINVLY